MRLTVLFEQPFDDPRILPCNAEKSNKSISIIMHAFAILHKRMGHFRDSEAWSDS